MNKEIYKKYDGKIYSLVYEAYDTDSDNPDNVYDNIEILNTILINNIYYSLDYTDTYIIGINKNKNMWATEPLMDSDFSYMVYKKDDGIDYIKCDIRGVFYG